SLLGSLRTTSTCKMLCVMTGLLRVLLGPVRPSDCALLFVLVSCHEHLSGFIFTFFRGPREPVPAGLFPCRDARKEPARPRRAFPEASPAFRVASPASRAAPPASRAAPPAFRVTPPAS